MEGLRRSLFPAHIDIQRPKDEYGVVMDVEEMQMNKAITDNKFICTQAGGFDASGNRRSEPPNRNRNDLAPGLGEHYHRPLRTLLSVLMIAVPVTLILTLIGLSTGFVEDSRKRQARGRRGHSCSSPRAAV